jgi:hypothetical protein
MKHIDEYKQLIALWDEEHDSEEKDEAEKRIFTFIDLILFAPEDRNNKEYVIRLMTELASVKKLVAKGVDFIFRFSSDELKDDHDVVLAALACVADGIPCNNGYIAYSIFWKSSESVRNRKDVLLAACNVLQDVSSENWGAREVLSVASQRLKNNREVILKLISMDHRAFEAASEDLRNDIGVATAALEKCTMDERLLCYVGPSLRRNKGFILSALKKTWFGPNDIPISFRDDPEIMAALIENLKVGQKVSNRYFCHYIDHYPHLFAPIKNRLMGMTEKLVARGDETLKKYLVPPVWYGGRNFSADEWIAQHYRLLFMVKHLGCSAIQHDDVEWTSLGGGQRNIIEYAGFDLPFKDYKEVRRLEPVIRKLFEVKHTLVRMHIAYNSDDCDMNDDDY